MTAILPSFRWTYLLCLSCLFHCIILYMCREEGSTCSLKPPRKRNYIWPWCRSWDLDLQVLTMIGWNFGDLWIGLTYFACWRIINIYQEEGDYYLDYCSQIFTSHHHEQHTHTDTHTLRQNMFCCLLALGIATWLALASRTNMGVMMYRVWAFLRLHVFPLAFLKKQAQTSLLVPQEGWESQKQSWARINWPPANS